MKAAVETTADPRERFRDSKFILLTSYRKDGTGVPTQMWCVLDEGRLFVRTDSTSYKVGRIRRNPSIEAAPCDFKGEPKTEPFAARAIERTGDEAARIARLFGKKYPLGYYIEIWFLKPLHGALAAIRLGKARGDTIFYEIVPEER
jgi:PPOX class probable F420-dependent enzyme